MSQTWPREKIRELLALADTTGSASAVLASAREAELFRFAIYSFRRNTGLGQDLSVTLEGNNVIVTKRQEHYVTISQEQNTAGG